MPQLLSLLYWLHTHISMFPVFSITHPNTHLPLVYGLQGNNIHATLCQQIVPHFASQLHGTNLEPLAFALATTIPCWAIPCWAIATESCDYKLFFLSRTSSLRPLLFLKKKNVPQERGQEILAD